MNAVDTNVFVYSQDTSDANKHTKAEGLLRTLAQNPSQTILLWQVLGELVRKLRQWKDQGLITKPEFDDRVRTLRVSFPLRLPSSIVLDHALDLANRFSLSHWDSMLLGACIEAGVDTLYTEDMGSPRTIDTIQLVNPFI